MGILNRISHAFADLRKPAEAPKPQTASLWGEQAFDEAIDLLTKLPEVDDILAKAGVERYMLRKLESDDDLFGALRTRKDSVIATPWSFGSGKEDVKQFLTEELAGIVPFIIEGAWQAVPYGYSVMERVYRRRDDGKIGLLSCMVKPMQWFDIRPDGELRYFSPNGGSDGIPVDQTQKFILTRSGATYENPRGVALLAKLYWPWFFRFNGWRFWMQFLERFGQPLLVGKSNDPKAMAQALVKAHQDSTIGVGTNDAVEAVQPATEGGAFEKLENCITRRYTKLILGQTLTTDVSATGGGAYELGKVHGEVKESLRQADIRLVLPALQNVVNALCALNGITEDIPQIKLEDEKGLGTDRAERDTQLYTMGVRFTPEYIQDSYDLKPEHFTITEAKPQEEVVPGSETKKEEPVGKGAKKGVDLKKNEKGEQVKAGDSYARRYARDPRRFTPAQQEIEEAADKAIGLAGSPIDPASLRKAVMAARDEHDLEERLAALMLDADEEVFRETLAHALFLADVIGYVNAEGKL